MARTNLAGIIQLLKKAEQKMKKRNVQCMTICVDRVDRKKIVLSAQPGNILNTIVGDYDLISTVGSKLVIRSQIEEGCSWSKNVRNVYGKTIKPLLKKKGFKVAHTCTVTAGENPFFITVY